MPGRDQSSASALRMKATVWGGSRPPRSRRPACPTPLPLSPRRSHPRASRTPRDISSREQEGHQLTGLATTRSASTAGHTANTRSSPRPPRGRGATSAMVQVPAPVQGPLPRSDLRRSARAKAAGSSAARGRLGHRSSGSASRVRHRRESRRTTHRRSAPRAADARTDHLGDGRRRTAARRSPPTSRAGRRRADPLRRAASPPEAGCQPSGARTPAPRWRPTTGA